jgi:hypothetical protein
MTYRAASVAKVGTELFDRFAMISRGSAVTFARLRKSLVDFGFTTACRSQFPAIKERLLLDACVAPKKPVSRFARLVASADDWSMKEVIYLRPAIYARRREESWLLERSFDFGGESLSRNSPSTQPTISVRRMRSCRSRFRLCRSAGVGNAASPVSSSLSESLAAQSPLRDALRLISKTCSMSAFGGQSRRGRHSRRPIL